MKLQLKKIAKRAFLTWFGAETFNRVRGYHLNILAIRDHIRLRPLNAHIFSQLLSCKSFEKLDVLFFCDGLRQWPTIKLVVEEFIRRRGDLRLGLATTCAKEEFPDDFLSRGIPIIRAMQGSLFLFDTQILYTPLPGLSRYTRAKMPPKTRVVHALASMSSLDGTFSDHDFDAYDYILCAGSHHLDSFRKLALRRPALSEKWLLPAGYPKLDLMLASHSPKRHPTAPSVNLTIVYAPTHYLGKSLTSICQYGEAIINALLAEGHRVIFRPHPLSFGASERPVVDRICRLHADNPKFSLDASTDYTKSYSLADLMVTDLSGTGFTFSFSFGRPTIYFAPDAEAERGLSGLQFDARHRIGALVRDIDGLIGKTAELCHRDMSDEIERFRDETVFNVGKSAAYIVDCLENILSGCERPEWVRL